MELRHLRYFVAVAEALSFTRAAERLHIAQPPLSMQIRALEEELGAALFHRTKRRVSLTAAGHAFLLRARQILADAETARDEVGRAARGELGRLRIGFTSSLPYSPAFGDVLRGRDVDTVVHLASIVSPPPSLPISRRTAGAARRRPRPLGSDRSSSARRRPTA